MTSRTARKIFTQTAIVATAILCAAGLQAWAFTEPTGTPPLADVSASINVGPTSQDKSGSGNAWITADGIGSRYGALFATVSGTVSIGTTSSAGTLNIASPTGGTATICLNGTCTAQVGGSSSATTWHSQAFTSSGTWTQPSGVTSVNVLLVGGGGGGGGGNSGYGGGGGGGGAIVYYPNLPVSGNLTVTIGAGGVGAPYYNPPPDGHASTIAQGGTTLLTAPGGGGGTNWQVTGISMGGTAGNGYTQPGHDGYGSVPNWPGGTTPNRYVGGAGGQGGSSWGPGGNSYTHPNADSNTGGGGSGGGDSTYGAVGASSSGYNGGSGYAVIFWQQ